MSETKGENPSAPQKEDKPKSLFKEAYKRLDEALKRKRDKGEVVEDNGLYSFMSEEGLRRVDEAMSKNKKNNESIEGGDT